MINLSILTTAPVTPSVTVIRASASSVLDSYGPEGLFWSVDPGWHAARNPSYPQILNVDFGESRSFSELSFEPQDGLPQRMPKEVRIKTSNNGTDWTQMASATNLCAWDGRRSRVKISQSVQAKFLQIEILSNCGDPDFLTLKGLAVE
ncbi:MAG: discoidin domain-containing protein [Acidobacteria bacterium]|nr:discoidin domain-containing protein [Acidobacteriota bacterium]